MNRSNLLKVFLVLALTLCSGHAYAEQSLTVPALPEDLGHSVQRVLASKPGDLFVVLKNGLTLLARQSTEHDVVSAQVFVRAGSIYEGRNMSSGISHYLEHVLSGGTTLSFSEQEAKNRLANMGGSTNAYTTYDRTVYYINTGSDHWRDAVEMLLSYVSESRIDPNEVAREKAVIQQEIKMGENSADRELWKLFIQTAYLTNPVRLPVTGYEQVFVKLDRESVQDYYLQRYQPENIVVAVAGNVPANDLLRLVIQKTNSFSRRALEPSVIPEELQQASPRWEEKEVPFVRLVQAMVGFPSVTAYDKDVYALDLLAVLLGEGETCTLQCRLKDYENKVLGISASNWTPSFTRGQFMISMSLVPENWPSVLTAVDDEIEKFKREPVSAEDLEKAKKMIIARNVFSLETTSAQASTLGSSYFISGDPYFDATYIEGLKRVNPEDVREAARKYLIRDHATVTAIRPPGTQASHPVAESKGGDDQAQRAGTQVKTLSNGLKIIMHPDSSLPIITANLYGMGGSLIEDHDRPGLSALTSSLLLSGTRNLSKLELARGIERVGGEISARSDNNTYHVSVKILKEDWPLALGTLSDVLQNANFPQEEIERNRTDTLLSIRRADENWQSELARIFKKNYFEKSNYANDRLGTLDSVQSFSRDDILGMYRKMVNATNSVLAVYGDFNPETMFQSLNEKLGPWSGDRVEVANASDETRVLNADKLVDQKSDKSCPAILLGTNGLDIKSSDRPVLDVLNSVLSGTGYPGGRLFEALRGKDDLVYVVSSFPFYGINAGFFGIMTQTSQANLDQVQNILVQNLRQLADEQVPEEELSTAKNLLLTSHELAKEGMDAQAVDSALNELMGMGWDYSTRYPELVKAVTAGDVQRLAGELFRHTLLVRTTPRNPVEILANPSAGKAHSPE